MRRLLKKMNEWIPILRVYKKVKVNISERISRLLLEGVDAIENNFWVEGAYYREFESLCNGGILEERLWCSDAIADVEASRILKEWVGLQKSVCMQLVTQKLENYKTVAGNIMKENKVAVQEDAKQLQTQQRREKYSQVWFSFFQTLGSIGEFLGLTHFTPFPY